MIAEGVDYAWDRPTVAGLAAANKRFVVRYGGPGSAGKQLDAAEARALIAAGIALVANAEGAADGLKGGRTAGIAWARDADAHFRALGMPADRPIYLSVDFDADSAHWPAIDAALRGAAEVLGAARVGVYGGYDTIAHCVNAGTARWFWQTYAWSGGRWHPRAHIRQYRNHVPLAGGTVDLCQAMVADYGQWGQPREDDDMDAAQFVEILRNPSVATEMRRLAVGYTGGGIPEGMNVLNVLNETLLTSRATAARVGADLVDEQGIVAGVLAGLATVDLDAAAAALKAAFGDRADELAARLQS